MIYGTGVDIVEIARIRRSLEKYSERFQNKIFTPGEIDYCRSRAEPARHFAARFAVKEAVMKCLGLGMDQGIGWKDIEVLLKDTGKPFLNVSGKARENFDRLNLKTIHISISHEKEYAIAHALAEQ
ncbi:MAG: holo-ACP synthase [Nitrospinaceae bacterium]